tara:strand:- start:3191 stop:3625 length:435 start_codon:yes stop_codon:yes gene_type:complete
MKLKAVIVSGYFNPIHKGHIELFKKAKTKGDLLFVIVNNDHQRLLKGSKEFMLEDERVLIIRELKVTDYVILSIDTDKTVVNTIRQIHKEYSDKYELFFANGGDQRNESIPEEKVCNSLGIKLLDGLGEKVQSSSWLLKKGNEN